LKSLGPGLVTGASDNDPAGISTYAVTGASTGYSFLWLAFFSIPLMIATQDMAARIGAKCETGLGKFIGDTYGRKWFLLMLAALIIMNITTIGADLAGIAAALQLITGIHFRWFILPVSLLIIAIQIFWSYRVFARYMKYLTLILFAYVIDGFLAKPDWGTVLKNIILPHITWSRGSLAVMVGLLGTTISPYMLFWQASQELEEVKQEKNGKKTESAFSVKSNSVRLFDTAVGMIYSNIVAFFIILSSAATLNRHGITIQTASDAASALRPIAGDFAYVLFAVGIIGSGLIAIPVLAGSTAYPLSEWRGCPEGLDQPVNRAKCFYTILTASVLVGVLIAYLPINPIDALFYSQVLMGLLTPVVLTMLVLVTSNKEIMGAEDVNKPFFSIFGWISVFIIAVSGAALIWTLVT